MNCTIVTVDTASYDPKLELPYNSGDTLYLAIAHDTLFGYAIIRDEWLEHLFVNPQYRKQGIGCKLLRYVIQEFKQLKLIVNANNVGAYRLFCRMRFIAYKHEHRSTYMLYER